MRRPSAMAARAVNAAFTESGFALNASLTIRTPSLRSVTSMRPDATRTARDSAAAVFSTPAAQPDRDGGSAERVRHVVCAVKGQIDPRPGAAWPSG